MTLPGWARSNKYLIIQIAVKLHFLLIRAHLRKSAVRSPSLCSFVSFVVSVFPAAARY